MKKIIDLMKQYDATYAALNKKYQEGKESLAKAWGNGEVYEKKLDELEKEYYKTVTDLTDQFKADVNAELNRLEDSVKAFVVAPVPEGFNTVMEAIKLTGTNLTREEMKLFSEKFGSCYIVKKALSSAIDTTSKSTFIPYEDMIADLENVRKQVTNWITHYDPIAYSHGELMGDNSPLLAVEAALEDYVA